MARMLTTSILLLLFSFECYGSTKRREVGFRHSFHSKYYRFGHFFFWNWFNFQTSRAERSFYVVFLLPLNRFECFKQIFYVKSLEWNSSKWRLISMKLQKCSLEWKFTWFTLKGHTNNFVGTLKCIFKFNFCGDESRF